MDHTPEQEAARRAAIRAAYAAHAAEQAMWEAAEDRAARRIQAAQDALSREVPSPELRAALGMERVA